MWNEEYNGQRMDNLASLRSNIQDILNEIYNQMRYVFENLGGKRKTRCKIKKKGGRKKSKYNINVTKTSRKKTSRRGRRRR